MRATINVRAQALCSAYHMHMHTSLCMYTCTHVHTLARSCTHVSRSRHHLQKLKQSLAIARPGPDRTHIQTRQQTQGMQTATHMACTRPRCPCFCPCSQENKEKTKPLWACIKEGSPLQSKDPVFLTPHAHTHAHMPRKAQIHPASQRPIRPAGLYDVNQDAHTFTPVAQTDPTYTASRHTDTCVQQPRVWSAFSGH